MLCGLQGVGVSEGPDGGDGEAMRRLINIDTQMTVQT